MNDDPFATSAHSDGRDKSFIEYVVKQIVSDPDAVEVTRTVDEMGVLITLKVAQEDLGQVIGRNGQTAKSIRTLLRVVGAKNHARVNLKIYEPEGSRRPRPPRPERAAPAAPVEDDASTAIDDLNL